MPAPLVVVPNHLQATSQVKLAPIFATTVARGQVKPDLQATSQVKLAPIFATNTSATILGLKEQKNE